jgi:GNAT superfamily N-acetyltransferase
VSEVRELPPGQTIRGARTLLELRPQFGTPEALAARIDAIQRDEGYRLVGSFEEGAEHAAAVAGFRLIESLAWGRALYVDDLVTASEHRGQGHADALFAWLGDEAVRLGCDQLHLDSAVGPERADAHRFYFRHRLRIAAFHFARGVPHAGSGGDTGTHPPPPARA